MTSTDRPHLLCFGFGFTAATLAHRLLGAGWQVSGTSRSPDKRQAMTDDGIAAYAFDRDHPLPLDVLASATHVLASAAPDEQGDPVLDAHAADLSRSSARWIGYLSTTGVYGDHAGGWVDETTPANPGDGRRRRRFDAERGWQALLNEHGRPVHIFRLAGIYGPGKGRNAFEQLRSGRAQRVVKPGQVFSRAHVGDIASVLEASIARPAPGAIYNVADDDPAPPQDVITFAAELLGMAPPPEVPFDEAVLSPMQASFYADNRRVANGRIKRDLGVRLAYPSYRDGLRAILAEEQGR